jgi:hypothetical protein
MKTTIKVDLNSENGASDSWAVLLNQAELVEIAKSQGLEAANKALDGFVDKFVAQFKEKLSAVINK